MLHLLARNEGEKKQNLDLHSTVAMAPQLQ